MSRKVLIASVAAILSLTAGGAIAADVAPNAAVRRADGVQDWAPPQLRRPLLVVLNEELIAARLARIEAEALELRAARIPASLSQVVSDPLIISIRRDLQVLQLDAEGLSAEQRRNMILGLREALQQETQRISDRLLGVHDIALAREQALEAEIEQVRNEAASPGPQRVSVVRDRTAVDTLQDGLIAARLDRLRAQSRAERAERIPWTLPAIRDDKALAALDLAIRRLEVDRIRASYDPSEAEAAATAQDRLAELQSELDERIGEIQDLMRGEHELAQARQQAFENEIVKLSGL